MYKPNYQLTDKLLDNLIKLEVERNQIENLEPTVEQRDVFINQSKAVNMFHLAHTIGVDLTIKDAEKAAEGKKIVTEDARGTILNNFRNSLEYVRSSVTQGFIDIDLNILLHINKILLSDWKESWDSKFRTAGEEPDPILDNWLELRDKNIDHKFLMDEINSLLEWYKTEKEKIHPLIRIAVLLYRLMRIAPFGIANKLTTIAVADLLLYKNGYLHKTFLAITRDIDLHEDQYLQIWGNAVVNNDDMTFWIEHFMENLASELASHRAEINTELFEETKSSRKPFLDLNRRQLKILRYLQTIPTVRREDYVQMMDVSTMTAFRDLDDLVGKKLLRVEGKGRGTKYTLTHR